MTSLGELSVMGKRLLAAARLLAGFKRSIGTRETPQGYRSSITAISARNIGGGRIMGRLLTEIWRDLAKLKHELRSGNWYDYTKQAWVRGGRYVNCGHIDPFCGCYGRIHQGELASEAVLRDQLKALEAERAEAEYRFWMRGASVATRNVLGIGPYCIVPTASDRLRHDVTGRLDDAVESFSKARFAHED